MNENFDLEGVFFPSYIVVFSFWVYYFILMYLDQVLSVFLEL